jgi:putative radical SAM enzyme (TIGR03279 family)
MRLFKKKETKEYKHVHKITKIEEDSIAEALKIKPGDELLTINGQEMADVLDYHYLIHDENIELLIRKPNGKEKLFEFEKDYDDDLGIEFEDGLMDDYKSCHNKCIFCFIDQMPKGMRETLYFKDDDSRLSFLQGNYITLTNLSEAEIDRMIKYKLSPINISVQATNPELRCKMLNNRFAGNIMDIIGRFADAGIMMNTQVVLCKGYNDGAELDRTITDLSKYADNIIGLSVVPAGLTKFREGLAKLYEFDEKESMDVLIQIHNWQEKMLKTCGSRFVFASDEWYIKANHPIPPASYYEGYGQLENGVGMIRSLVDEVHEAIGNYSYEGREKLVSIATGVIAYPYIKELADFVSDHFPKVKVNVYKIINNFFGESITVAGLITGKDLIEQLTGIELGEKLLLTETMFRSGEETLLDDLTKTDVENALQTEIAIVKSEGDAFISSILE